MSVFVIADLHLPFGDKTKTMEVFGGRWADYTEKIKQNWLEKVKEDDTVILPGDFSWATYLEETYNDFEFLNSLPGKKILLKGNHDYWWTTLTNIKNYLKEKQNIVYQVLKNSFSSSWQFSTDKFEEPNNNSGISTFVFFRFSIFISVKTVKPENFSHSIISKYSFSSERLFPA